MFTRQKKAECTLAIFSLFTMLVLALVSCSSPFVLNNSGDCNLTVKLVVPGEQSSPSKGRLMLDTAHTISIRLVPEQGDKTILAGPDPVVNGSATIMVKEVPLGRYTIIAEARDVADVIVFKQTARNVGVGVSSVPVVLAMVPTDASGAEFVPTTVDDLSIPELAAGKSWSVLLAPGSQVLKASSLFFSDLAASSKVFLQTVDGELLGQQQGANARFSTASLPPGKAVFLTVYNGGVAVQPTARAFNGPIMVRIPAGTEPSTGVPVNSFYMASTEVTQEQFERVMGFNYSEWSELGVTIPVGNVTMYDAMAYCNALSAMEGLEPVYSLAVNSTYGGMESIQSATYSANFQNNGYRLPTLSERIWATRGGTSTVYYWGDTISGADTYEWHDGNSSGHFKLVAGKEPNNYGLYDMGGNVYEWSWGTEDPSSPLPTRAGGTARNPATDYLASEMGAVTGPECGGGLGYYDNGFRVVRNGTSIPSDTKLIYSYDFESLAIGGLNGQDGWTTTEYGGPYMDIITSTLGPNTSKIAYNPIGWGAGQGVSASKFHGLTLNPSKKYILKADLYTNVWGNVLGFAHDANSDGKSSRDGSPNEQAFSVSSTGSTIQVSLPDGTLNNYSHSFGGGHWIEVSVVLDFSGNTYSMYSRLPGGALISNAELVPLGINGIATDRTNPSNWNLLYMHFEHLGMADNIKVFEIR